MAKILSGIEELNALFHQPTIHPLMSVGNRSTITIERHDYGGQRDSRRVRIHISKPLHTHVQKEHRTVAAAVS